MSVASHPSVAKVAKVLREHAADGDVRELSDSAKTAVLAAAALGVDVGQIVNSLVFDSDGEPLLVLTSGAHRVDTSRVAVLVGAKRVGRADPAFVRQHTAQVIGGVAPVGHPAPIRTLVDTWLAPYGEVWAAAGHSHTVFRTTYDELLRLTGGQSADVGAPA